MLSLLRELGDLKKKAGWVGGGFGWQLVGVLISRSNQKMIVRRQGKIKAGFREREHAVFSTKSQEVRVRPQDSLTTYFNMFVSREILSAISQKH